MENIKIEIEGIRRALSAEAPPGSRTKAGDQRSPIE
jgi:hypothetical protein